MKFVPNPHIDAVRASYRIKYDEIMKQIHETDDLSEKRRLQKKEQRLNMRTKRFISRHNAYFTAKRKHHIGKIENAGAFEYDEV